ncbi:MAG: hypothetical protein ABI140_07325 [Jatrophihabitantaceae bacterium]
MTGPGADTVPVTGNWRLWLVYQVWLAQEWLISRLLPWVGVILVLEWERRLLTGGDARTVWLLVGVLLVADGLGLRAFLRWRRTAVGSPASWRQALAVSWAGYALDWAGLLTVAIRAGSGQPDYGAARAVIAAGVLAWALISIARRRARTRGGQWLAFAASCQDAAAVLLLAGYWEPDLARHVRLFEVTGLLWLALLVGVLPLGSVIGREFGLSHSVSADAQEQS